MGRLARKVAIVGAGMSKFGFNYPKLRMIDMWQEAWLEAVKLTDKEIKPEDIDELFLGNFTADLFNHQGHLAPQPTQFRDPPPAGCADQQPGAHKEQCLDDGVIDHV